MRVTVLGSGSGGNATLVETDDARLLVDAGFSGRDLERRLRAVDVEPESLSGIVITHEHIDHTQGMGVLARRFGLPLYLTEITRRACARLLTGGEEIRTYDSQRPFRVGSLEVRPFLTIHDAADPVAVTIRDVVTRYTLAIATDLGRPTAAVRHALRDANLLILEANHDDTMLWNSSYPWSVKQRIASSHGHLSNRAAAELMRELYGPQLGGVVLAHLSEQCNVPELAGAVVGETLGGLGFRGRMEIARQDEPLEPLDVAELVALAGPDQLSLL